MIFADPSIATLNFNNTIANAGANNLLNATNGSAITFNASASMLTGAQTDSTSTANVNLTNGTTWTMTGSSTLTNLRVTNSAVVFAPPGSGAGFKTLTVTNYVGSGANITLYAALGGSNSASDKTIINGGRRNRRDLADDQERRRRRRRDDRRRHTDRGCDQRGDHLVQRLLARHHAGRRRVQIHARSNQPGLVSRVLADRVGRADHELDQHRRPKAQQTQIITNRVLTSILLGANEQISCSSCGWASPRSGHSRPAHTGGGD